MNNINKYFESIVLKAICMMLVFATVLSCSACLRPVSVDRCGYVVAIGVDVGDKKDYEITLELQRESSGDAKEGGGAIILSCEARDLFEAVSELSTNAAYDLNFTRTHIFIVAEQLACDGKIEDILNMSFDVLRIRKSALMVISRAPVRDYIGGLASNNTANIAKMQDALISNVETTGETAAINISLFFEAVDGGRFDPVMPIGEYDESIITDRKQLDNAEKGINPIADATEGKRIGGMQGLTHGCALFDGGRMCGELSADETQFMNLVRGDFRRGTIAYPLENGEMASLLVFVKKRKIDVKLDSGIPSAMSKLSLNITVERDPLRNIGKNWEHSERDKLISFFENKLKDVFEKCRSCSSDAMGFGRYASMNFHSTEKFEMFSWKKTYENLSVEFNVELNLDDEYLINIGK